MRAEEGEPISAWAAEDDSEKKGGLSRGWGFSRVLIAKGEFFEFTKMGEARRGHGEGKLGGRNSKQSRLWSGKMSKRIYY